jgi:hypothetical protein
VEARTTALLLSSPAAAAAVQHEFNELMLKSGARAFAAMDG